MIVTFPPEIKRRIDQLERLALIHNGRDFHTIQTGVDSDTILAEIRSRQPWRHPFHLYLDRARTDDLDFHRDSWGKP